MVQLRSWIFLLENTANDMVHHGFLVGFGGGGGGDDDDDDIIKELTVGKCLLFCWFGTMDGLSILHLGTDAIILANLVGVFLALASFLASFTMLWKSKRSLHRVVL